MQLQRRPGLLLRPFVQTLWASDTLPDEVVARERVLPTGAMHVVIRLSDTPLRLFDDVAGHGARVVGHAIVGGARSSFYVRDVSRAVRSVGAQLHPGAASVVLGVPASALAETHTSLDDLWGPSAKLARERIAEPSSLEAQLDVFEAILLAGVQSRMSAPRGRGIHPAVAWALSVFSAREQSVGAVVASTGYSHRRFIEIFHEAVGLTPKTFCRIARFQHALSLSRSGDSWAAVACEAGYGDQSHLNRDFISFSGLPPGRYRALKPHAGQHVAIR